MFPGDKQTGERIVIWALKFKEDKGSLFFLTGKNIPEEQMGVEARCQPLAGHGRGWRPASQSQPALGF